MYEKWSQTKNQRGNSWADTGPELSFHCSISTSPSVAERQLIYNNYHSPVSTIQSFLFSFPNTPSPNYSKIGNHLLNFISKKF